MYLAKSDAFDINAMPIKVGRIRISFTPPLWTKGPDTELPDADADADADTADIAASDADGFVQTLDIGGGRVTIVTKGGYRLRVYVDANAPVLRVAGSHAVGFSATAKLELYNMDANWVRNFTRPVKKKEQAKNKQTCKRTQTHQILSGTHQSPTDLPKK